MLGSAILDVAIGLIFTFLSVSLAASAAVEAGSSILKYRSKTLRTGIMALLNDPGFDTLAARLYAHALINPRGPGLAASPAALPQPVDAPVAGLANPPAAPNPMAMRLAPVDRARLMTDMPAYIDAKQFASALMDVISLNQPTVAELKAAVDAAVPVANNPQINQLLNGLIVRANGDLAAIHLALAGWFDNAMDRLSGAYKRWSQVWGLGAALAISIILNADAIQVAQRIWAQPVLISGIKAGAAQEDIVNDKANAAILPLGWTTARFLRPAAIVDSGSNAGEATRIDWPAVFMALLGWMITALASLFGAPFWFDTLQQVIRLKGAGPSPGEKADRTAAAS